MSRTDLKKNEEHIDTTAFVFMQTWFGIIVDYGFKFFIYSSKYDITNIMFCDRERSVNMRWKKYLYSIQFKTLYIIKPPLSNTSV